MSSASSAIRADSCHDIADEMAGDRIDELRDLLEDDAPFVFTHGGRRMISEVRFAALSALQALYRGLAREPDFGPVLVRKATSVEEALAQAATADAQLEQAERARLNKSVDDFVQTRVRPDARDAEAVRAYRLLQELGRLEYRREEVDPISYMTPLQAEVSASQLTSSRPKPHLRFVSIADGRTLGYLYKSDGRWVQDFAEDAEAGEVRSFLDKVFTIERGAIPRVRFSDSGQPLLDDVGAFVFDGSTSLADGEAVELLRSVQALMGDKRPCELAC